MSKVFFRLAGEKRVHALVVPSLALDSVQQAAATLLGLEPVRGPVRGCVWESVRATDAETGERLVAHARKNSTVVFHGFRRKDEGNTRVGEPVQEEDHAFHTTVARPTLTRTTLTSTQVRLRPGPLDCKPPAGYLCKLCREPGHFCRKCPNRDRVRAEQRRVPKPATGIPRSTLVPAEAPTPAPVDPDEDTYTRPAGGLVAVDGRLLTTIVSNKFEKLMQECRVQYRDPDATSVRACLCLCAACQQPCAGRESGPMTTRCCFSTFCAACAPSGACCVCRVCLSTSPDAFQNKRLQQIKL